MLDLHRPLPLRAPNPRRPHKVHHLLGAILLPKPRYRNGSSRCEGAGIEALASTDTESHLTVIPSHVLRDSLLPVEDPLTASELAGHVAQYDLRRVGREDADSFMRLRLRCIRSLVRRARARMTDCFPVEEVDDSLVSLSTCLNLEEILRRGKAGVGHGCLVVERASPSSSYSRSMIP